MACAVKEAGAVKAGLWDRLVGILVLLCNMLCVAGEESDLSDPLLNLCNG